MYAPTQSTKYDVWWFIGWWRQSDCKVDICNPSALLVQWICSSEHCLKAESRSQLWINEQCDEDICPRNDTNTCPHIYWFSHFVYYTSSFISLIFLYLNRFCSLYQFMCDLNKPLFYCSQVLNEHTNVIFKFTQNILKMYSPSDHPRCSLFIPWNRFGEIYLIINGSYAVNGCRQN